MSKEEDDVFAELKAQKPINQAIMYYIFGLISAACTGFFFRGLIIELNNAVNTNHKFLLFAMIMIAVIITGYTAVLALNTMKDLSLDRLREQLSKEGAPSSKAARSSGSKPRA